MRLLLVEDDAQLSADLKETLTHRGYAVDTAADGIEAQYLGEAEQYDAVVLDLGLPGRPGLEVLQNWRRHGKDAPVLILTARDAWQEKVEGFKAGADDYLAKPFHVEELVARLGALIRRRSGVTAGGLEVEGLKLDEETQSVTLPDGTRVQLTGTEFRLLRYFMLHPGRILSKTRLTEHVYEYDADKDSNVIEVYVNRLRGKIGKTLFRTRRGQGYVFGSEK
jgi:two-component system OmpR family response regulator